MELAVTVKNEKNSAISLIRLVATVFIVLCHFFQYYNMEAAWWFNVGVSMFFCISGFLYGNKRITSLVDYISKTFKKILIPYYCYLAVAVVVYFIFHRELISREIVFRAALTSGTIRGIEHLWFISYILFCYLLTPYLQAVADRIKGMKWYVFMLAFSMLAILGHHLSVCFSSYFSFPSLFCYLFGYFVSVLLHNYKYTVFRNLMLIFVLVTAVMNGIRIYGTYVAPISISRFDLFVSYAHGFLGISLVLIFATVFKNIKPNRLLELSDKYSFYIYIVHQLYILSPFTLLTATDSAPVNIGLTVAAILISAPLLKLVSDGVGRVYAKAMGFVKSRSYSPVGN